MNAAALRTVLMVATAVIATDNAVGRPDPHSSHQVPSIPTEILERPIGLREGIGLAHDAVMTRSKRAQALYDQGVAYLHSYAWIDAARSFNDALRADPALALACVGLSYAYEEVNQPDAARAALERAQGLAGGASPHDRKHIEIRALQMRAVGNALRAALDRALEAFPNDAELWLLRGVAASDDPTDRGQGSTLASIPFYERALAVRPDHFAAHHYLTHAYENAGRIDEALDHARHYARLAPAVPHAHHMLGHDLRRVGRIGEAIAEFRKAYDLETAPDRAAQVSPHYDWHHQHNLDLLATSHQYLGQVKKAEALMRISFETASPLVLQEFNKHEWPAFLLARGRTDDALAAAEALKRRRAALVRGIGHVMAGRAWLMRRKFAEAANASNLALEELRTAGPERSLAAPHLEGLQAEFFLHTGDREKAVRIFREVRRTIRALPGPDAWSQGLFQLESIGRSAVSADAWELAAETAADMRAHDASYGGTHYLLALVAEHDGERENTLRHLERAERAWHDADADFSELVDVRKRIAQLKSRSGSSGRSGRSVPIVPFVRVVRRSCRSSFVSFLSWCSLVRRASFRLS